MKRLVRAMVAVAVVGLCAACGDDSEARVDPGISGGENIPVGGGSTVYPGGRDAVVSESRGVREMYFRTDDSIEQVFAHFDEGVRSDGWNVLEQRTDRTMMESWYLSGRQTLRLEVARENSDIFRVRMETADVAAPSDADLAEDTARPLR